MATARVDGLPTSSPSSTPYPVAANTTPSAIKEIEKIAIKKIMYNDDTNDKHPTTDPEAEELLYYPTPPYKIIKYINILLELNLLANKEKV